MSGEVSPGVLLDVRTQLEEAACEMDATLRQAASSAAIARHGGSAAGFYTGTGSLIIGGRESHPLLLEAAAESLAFLVRQQAGVDQALAGGDLYWTNDPRCGAAGLEDLVLACPLLQDGRLVCFVAVTASHAALGRATLAPVESLRREGLILPWTRVSKGGTIQTELLDLLAANCEAPTEFLEDLQAQIHSLRLGQAVADGLLDGRGALILALVWGSLGAGCRQALQGILGKLETGIAEGRVAPFVVRVRRDGEAASVSMESEEPGTSPFISSALARAAVRAAFRELLTAEVPAMNTLGGWSDAVRVEMLGDPPAPDIPMGAARHAAAQRLAEAVLEAFAERLPHLTHAPDAGCLLLDLRGEREDGTRYRMRLELGGGLGASVFGDGLTHATPPFQPQRLRPVEAIERATPLRVLRFELRPDSGGPGQYRGGLGAMMALQLLEGGAEVDVLLPGRPKGLRGGTRGAGARLVLLTPEEGMREETGPAQITLTLRAGHCLFLESPGGAGWGLPFQRSIMRVEEDLSRGLITRDQSKNRYGVVLKPGSLDKDDHLTYRVRHYLLSTLAVEDIIAGEELLGS